MKSVPRVKRGPLFPKLPVKVMKMLKANTNTKMISSRQQL